MVKSVSTTLSLLFLLMLAGCGEQAEVIELAPLTMPEDHANPATPATTEVTGPRQVVIPELLQGKFQYATLQLQYPGMAQPTSLKLPLNGKPQQTDHGTLLVRDYLPAFLISGNTITSEGVEEKNPAIWAEWQRNGEKVFSGWLFRDYPSLNPTLIPEHQITFSTAH